MAPRRRVKRFTGFISEPSGCFVSQRICVRTRHTAIQKSREKRRNRRASPDASANLSSIKYSTNHNGKHPHQMPIAHQQSLISGFAILRPTFLICSPETNHPSCFRESETVISRSLRKHETCARSTASPPKCETESPT
ncbi:hypothetical protein D1006_28075 [Burkholderia stabilis]|uniref:Uncharacterized protein n=1 Tax=Burkholderia stabilis TaxID=95485 RepID=A0A4Q2AGE4_9BURK|nr:hypothetical protein D1006_28075 [Burkholderia stabilis]